MELLPVVVVLVAALTRATEAKPVFIYADCHVSIEGASLVGPGLIVVDQADTCSRWVCDRTTKKGYIEQCSEKDMGAKCEDIAIYSRKCYKGYATGNAELKYPDCCGKQIEICPGDPGYTFEKFKEAEAKYTKEEPYLWCARDSP